MDVESKISVTDNDLAFDRDYRKISITVVFITLVSVALFRIFGMKNRSNGTASESGDKLDFSHLPRVKATIPFKLIGALLDILPISRSLEIGERWSQELGDLWTVQGFNRDFVVFNSGPVAQTLLKSAEFAHIEKPPMVYGPMKPFIKNGVLVSHGTFWQQQRKILLRSQSYQSLKAYIGILNRHGRNIAADLEKTFEDGNAHEISGIINTTFLGVISEVITGIDSDRSDELCRYHKNFNIWKDLLMHRIIMISLVPKFLTEVIWKLHPRYWEHKKAVEELLDFAKRRIRETRKTREKASISKSQEIYGDQTKPTKPIFRSVIDELLDANVDEEQIVDEVNTMMFGGHETGAGAINFFCFALALNQQVQLQARKEVDEFFEYACHFSGSEISFDAIQSNLKYVERCILETMRLFPPVFAAARQLSAPLQVDYNGKSVIIPTGAVAIIPPFGIHRREKYFPNPHKFDPNRFLPEETAKRHAYSYIPFLAGPRNCIGQKFAMIEMKILSAYIIRHFEMSTNDKMEDIKLLPSTTLTPAKDFTFQFRKRNVTPASDVLKFNST